MGGTGDEERVGSGIPRATRELGQLVTEHIISTLAGALKAVKADAQTLKLQEEYFDRVLEGGKDAGNQ